MTTFTNGSTFMVPEYELETTVAVLKQGGVILYPTDTVWSLGCDATDPEAVENLRKIKQADMDYTPEVLVDSLNMIKRYTPHLHPRLETLLSFHVRPMGMLLHSSDKLAINLPDPQAEVAFRLAQDHYCRELVGALGRPIVAAPAAIGNFDHPTTFGGVRSDIIRQVDLVVRYRQNEKIPGELPVLVRLSGRGELEFIRE